MGSQLDVLVALVFVNVSGFCGNFDSNENADPGDAV